MITYQSLANQPALFRRITGHNLADFDVLFAEFQLAAAAAQAHHTKQPGGATRERRRSPGAGRPALCAPQTQLVMTLFWLRVYPTFVLLGFFFGLHESNAWRNVQDALTVLQTLAHFAFEKPAQERKALRSLEAVMDAFPDVALVIDAKEQRIQRPRTGEGGKGERGGTGEGGGAGNDPDRQKPYYSGKKKAHTLKNQVAVLPNGTIAAVSASVPGGANHDKIFASGENSDLTLLRETKLLDNLCEGEAAMLDKGYDGIRSDYPGHGLYLPYKARRNRPLTDGEKAYNRFLSSYRIVVEHTNARLNQYRALSGVWRQRRERHTGVVRVIGSLVNRGIAQVPLKRYKAQLSLSGALAA